MSMASSTNQNADTTSIDIGFLERMGYEFNEDKTECRPYPTNDSFETWRPVQEVIDDYVDFWRNNYDNDAIKSAEKLIGKIDQKFYESTGLKEPFENDVDPIGEPDSNRKEYEELP